MPLLRGWALLPLAAAHLTLPEIPVAPEALAAALQRRREVAEVSLAPWAEAAAARRPDAAAEQEVVGPHAVCGNDSEQFSGLLPAGGGARYFFWLAHSRSAAPREDPLAIWLTGGPGCSSSLALLSENGPCRVAGSHTNRTERNAWSWTEAANVAWVDQPAGVGFSEGPAIVSEREVAEHMYAFIQSFYGRFPEFLSVPLFLLGESYAGHYLPAVAARILEEPVIAGTRVQLHGVGIGNGLVNPWPQFASYPAMAYTGGVGGSLGHGVVPRSTFLAMEAVLPECRRLLLECERPPREPRTCLEAFETCVMSQLSQIMMTRRNFYDLRKGCADGYPMCYNFSQEAEFLRDPQVQAALGVRPGRGWETCNRSILLAFVMSGDWLQRFDQRVAELLGAGVRVLVYNGDADFMVDWIGSKSWAAELEWPHRDAWAAARDVPFVVSGIVRGLERTAAGLTFLQLYNAGHFVPQDQPEAALAMLREFLSPASRWAAGSGAGADAAAVSTASAGLEPLVLPTAALLAFGAMTLVLSAWRVCRAAAAATTGKHQPLLAA